MPSRSSIARPRNRLVVVGAVSSLVLVAAGCGSSSDSGSNGAGAGSGELSASQQECLDNATAYLDERGLLPESLPEELTPLSKPPTEGLTITRVGPAGTPTSVALGEKIVELAPEIGWTGRAVNFDGSVEDLNRKLTDAIASSDIVVVDGQPTAAIQGPIQAAKDKGVLLMIASTEEPPQSVPGFGGSPYGGETFPRVGELAAYPVMQATDCQANVAVFSLPTPALTNMGDSLEKTLKENCEDCSYSYTDIPFADIGSPAATNAVVSKLQSDPSINFAFFTIGDLAVGLGPALTQAGIDVQVGGAIPVPQNLQATEQGEDTFWLGFPQETSAWVVLDTAARALDSGEPTVGDHYPVPVYTPDNIATTDEIPAYPTDIGEQFKELWHVN
jgi:ABC-type sugar transport system substrate-binding protein